MSEYSAQEMMQAHIAMRLERTVEALRKNRMDACWVKTKEDALQAVRGMLKKGATVSNGGSMTLGECGIIELLRSGDYNYLDREGIPREEVPALYHKALSADYYLMSSNAVTEAGELYNVDGNGNRVAALIYGPAKVIVVAGANKIVADIPAAIERMKRVTAPANAMRLHCDTPCTQTGVCAGVHGGMAAGCRSEQRICASYVVSGCQRIANRITVILVAETLGY